MDRERRIDETNNSLTLDQPSIQEEKHEAQQNVNIILKDLIEWDDGETQLLLDLYDKFIQEVGQDKTFKTIDDLWIAVGSEITRSYKVIRSPLDCMNKFDSLNNETTTSESENSSENSDLTTDEIESNFNPRIYHQVLYPGLYIALQIQEEIYFFKIQDNEDIEDHGVYFFQFPEGDEDTNEFQLSEDIEEIILLIDNPLFIRALLHDWI
ncbi:uncharacterized protein LOC112597060 isoform X2 [Melanaphis sacchari]|nr:uncharacterized protein LOC112597060 isoform X2 [Melanaphis sacchari]XP_025198776.1 uncharacterized protein LOC112597060 isoform X2 [Melanaphis sacchari]